MKITLSDAFNQAEIADVKAHVEDSSIQIDNIVNSVISQYCEDLDRYVLFIKDCLSDGENPPTTVELDDFCLNLSTYIYFASSMSEYLGIRDDIAKALYKEMYNKQRDSITTGTVADKNTLAELESQKEQLVSVIYTRSYKIVRNKVEAAQELLSSCKKVLSRRISSEQLTRLSR